MQLSSAEWPCLLMDTQKQMQEGQGCFLTGNWHVSRMMILNLEKQQNLVYEFYPEKVTTILILTINV